MAIKGIATSSILRRESLPNEGWGAARFLYLKASFAEAGDQVFDHVRLPPDR